MKNILRFSLLLVAAVSLSSCITMMAEAPSVVEVKSDSSKNLSELKTYDWDGPQLPVGDERVDKDSVTRRIRWIMESALTQKGFTRAQNNPDCLVHYEASLEGQTDQIDETGNLTLEILDPKNGHTWWHAKAKALYSMRDPIEKRDGKIATAVSEMFSHFPK